jgi:ribosomal protein S18 acetylase RimI-like enzyme
MTAIRLMTPDDVDAVRRLDVQAFLHYMRKAGHGGPSPMRTRDNVLACIALHPQGCFVAEKGRNLVGYIFSRTWGKMGWIGVFGVRPDNQGQGIGSLLLRRATESLDTAGCTTIVLETMPDCPANVGFYARNGFRPAYSVVTLTKQTAKPRAHQPYALLSSLHHETALRAVSAISRAAAPGLDYAPESRNANQFGWGDTILVGWPEPWAAVIVRLAAKREGDQEPAADAAVIVGTPQARQRLPEILGTIETFAAEGELQWLAARIDTVDWATCKGMLDYGFSASHVSLRMVLRGKTACPAGLNLSRCAM